MLSLSPSVRLITHLQEAAEASAEVKQFLAEHGAAAEEMCDDLDPAPPAGQPQRYWRHQVVPVAVVRAAARAQQQSLQTWLAAVNSGLPEDAPDAERCTFVLAPMQKSVNPNRRRMRHRIARIDAAVETALYNEMLAGGALSNPTDVAATTAFTARKPASMSAMTLDATNLGGVKLSLGGSLRDAQRGAEERAKPETFSVIMKDVGVGLDVRLMSLAGGIVGYYLCASRSLPTEHCIIGGAIGAVFMLFVDAALLMLRMGREDIVPKPARPSGRVPAPKRGAKASGAKAVMPTPAASAGAARLKGD
jgi:hypothetical protein